MEKKNGLEAARDSESEQDAKSRDRHAPASDSHGKSSKKRRKVNHACVYCRRSHMTCDLERPCMRCIKRNIGHLCHDEPRDPDSKKSRSVAGASTADESETQSETGHGNSMDQQANTRRPPSFDGTGGGGGSLGAAGGSGQTAKAAMDARTLRRTNPLQLVQPTPVPGIQANAFSSSLNEYAGFPDALLSAQNHFHDMHSYHHNYMIVPEVTNEFNLLNDFLHSSILDDAALLPDEQSQNQLLEDQPSVATDLLNESNSGTNANANSSNGNSNSNSDSNNASSNASNKASNKASNSAGAVNGGSSGNSNLLPPGTMQPGAMGPPGSNADHGRTLSRPSSVVPIDKAREYYLQAADPSGNDTPEERMQRVLRAKYDAGLLKPFNYIKGYARLSAYLETHVAPASRQKVLRQLDRFRPKFREKSQALTDMDLVYVEMWFEKTLLEYDRVFASMAVPACCWRRTGEIFRGNKEMAELINVPVETLRGGKIALHEILTEESVVRYWEEFGTIAFDPAHDTLLTACSLKSPDDKSNQPIINCCFSFMIRRDEHKIPCLIVGNFLPHDPQ